MTILKLDLLTAPLTLAASAIILMACTRDPVMSEETMTSSTTTDPATTGPATTTLEPSTDDTTGPEPKTDLPPAADSSTGDVPSCAETDTCGQVDLVFVIDNSGSMGQEQLHLVRSFEYLIDELRDLRGADGTNLYPDVNIMVTTTDMGHPLCTAFQKPDYTPALGAPIDSGCNARINRFTGLDPMNPVIIEEACTENCPTDVLPGDHFINFSANGSNVPNDDAAAALECIGPQGVDGCGYESPLETMLQAVNEGACWNDPDQSSCDDDPRWADTTEGFLRDDAMLAIVLVTDELDCSVNAPGGYSYFTDVDNDIYRNVNPQLGIPQASSAICFNAGVSCTDGDGDGVYEECASQDNDALHPVDRYISYLDYLRDQGKEVVMLGLLGIPEVLAHSPEPPFEPTAGGLIDMVYRGEWLDFPYPAGDILPSEWDLGERAENKVFELGDLAPGCFVQNDSGNFVAQALPPVRIRDVCESLDSVDESGEPIVRCCIESVCGSDLAPSLNCLAGLTSEALGRAG